MRQKTWSLEEIRKLFDQPLITLTAEAMAIHAANFQVGAIQVAHLVSVKTGGCQEDCRYCAQSSRYTTSIKAKPMMSLDEVLAQADHAIARGAKRICLGAAWRGPNDGPAFRKILEMVSALAKRGVEVCCTLGLIDRNLATQIKDAGATAYNHNLDTSREFYSSIVTTRTYDDRIETLNAVRKAGLQVCCGGIIGLGESQEDRISLLHTLASLDPHPESVPINSLQKVPGTPFEDNQEVSVWETVRVIAVARILMPRSFIRLTAGRLGLTYEQQALCFFAGANSLFIGEKLLTVGNPTVDADDEMFRLIGLRAMGANDARISD